MNLYAKYKAKHHFFYVILSNKLCVSGMLKSVKQLLIDLIA